MATSLTYTPATTFANLSGNQNVSLVDAELTAIKAAFSGTATAISDVDTEIAAQLRKFGSGGLITYVSGTSISVGPGVWVDDAGTVLINQASTITMSSLGAFVAGTNQPKNSSDVTLANGMTLFLYIISQAAGALPDILLSSAASAPALPSGYTKSRRWFSFKFTAGAQTFISGLHYPDLGEYVYNAGIGDIAGVAGENAGVLRTLSVPTGLIVTANVHHGLYSGASARVTLLTDPAATNTAASYTSPLGVMHGGAAGGFFGGQAYVRTNASAQIRSRQDTADAGANFNITTWGYRDLGGRGT